MTRQELERYIAQAFGAAAEYPWAAYPHYAVFRHGRNRKWFAVVMDIPKDRLGLQEAGEIEILNVKCDPLLVTSLWDDPGFFPAYHMNKTNWITIALDGTVEDERILWLLDRSYDLTAPKRKKKLKNPDF